MNFASPGFLFFLPIVLFPLLLHLFQRRPPKHLTFGYIHWLKKVHQTHMPRKKLRDILLLIIRTLFLLFLIFFFARPTWEGGGNIGGQEEGEDFLILLDVSASMGTVLGGQTGLDGAKNILKELTQKMGAWNRLGLIAFSDQIEKEVALTNDRAVFMAAVNSQNLTWKSTDIKSSLSQAMKMLSVSKNKKKTILVLSDMASHGWSNFEPTMDIGADWDPTVRVVFYEVLPEQFNRGFHSAVLDASEEGRLLGQAWVHQDKKSPDTESWSLKVNNTVVQQGSFDKSGGTEVLLPLQAQFPKGPYFYGMVTKNTDSAAYDDTYYLAGRLPLGYRVLIVDGESGLAPSDSEAYYLKTALESPRDPRIEKIHVIRPENLGGTDLDQFDVIVLANVGRFENREMDLRAWLEKGGGMMITAGPHWPGKDKDPLGWVSSLQIAQDNQTVRPPEKNSYLNSALVDTAQFEWDELKSFPYVKLPMDAASTPILLFKNGDPLLLKKKVGDGQLVYLTSSLDRAWTNFPTKPVFSPLMRDLIATLADPHRNQNTLMGEVGRAFVTRLPPNVKNVVLRGPDGRLETVLRLPEGDLEFSHPTQPGLYEVDTEPKTDSFYFAINIPRLHLEGRLDRISEEKIKKLLQGNEVIFIPFQTRGVESIWARLQGWDMTTTLLVLVFVLFFLETILPTIKKVPPSWVGIFLFLLLLPPASLKAAGGNQFVWMQLRHAGDWDPYPNVEERVFQTLKQMTNIPFQSQKKVVSLKDETLLESCFLLVKGNSHFELSSAEKRQLKEFVDRGGFVLFDDSLAESRGAFSESVRMLMAEIFPDNSLRLLASDHALFRSFFLLKHAAGRRMGSKQLEGLDVGGMGGGEGRTAVVLSSNDLLGVWPKDNLGQYLFTCTPGGEAQRWEAMKLTINIIYFSLTGTYKKDAVHQPFIEQKLGN